ncbi:hypothetical protein Agabi119p4_11194 [Agaricus bisporus var. burnettii]|uniref:Uncharacterized protein n=1 Tax=Agaricus bisporus var. burnettii TaxID=192524 RepID=A0A8H7C1U0_AGABI|nr:hypothetical protein Agabi119p4_11194 [Agaricus bisporus var. burnettii]
MSLVRGIPSSEEMGDTVERNLTPFVTNVFYIYFRSTYLMRFSPSLSSQPLLPFFTGLYHRALAALSTLKRYTWSPADGRDYSYPSETDQCYFTGCKSHQPNVYKKCRDRGILQLALIRLLFSLVSDPRRISRLEELFLNNDDSICLFQAHVLDKKFPTYCWNKMVQRRSVNHHANHCTLWFHDAVNETRDSVLLCYLLHLLNARYNSRLS